MQPKPEHLSGEERRRAVLIGLILGGQPGYVVEEHLDDSDLDVATLAREVGLSRAQLRRKLKALTGQSTGEFVRRLRLQRGAQLLAGRFGNVTEVAMAVGFQNPSYFARCFREEFGTPPSGYADRKESEAQG